MIHYEIQNTFAPYTIKFQHRINEKLHTFRLGIPNLISKGWWSLEAFANPGGGLGLGLGGGGKLLRWSKPLEDWNDDGKFKKWPI